MTNQASYRRGRHVVSALHVHLVFVTKYRHGVLDDAMLRCCEELTLQPKTYNQVIAQVIANCVVAKTPCNWDMANYGTGFTFAPDYLPTGEVLFMCGAIGNSGGFCDTTNDSLINHTLTSGNLSYMYNWQNYLAPRLPVIWQPDGAYSLTEVADNLRGVNPQSPTLSINPEDWYFVK